MGETGDRMDRAGRYVLGLMDDEERERAERDLEIDPSFRSAMVEIAERMHVFDRTPALNDPAGGRPLDGWRLIKERIEAMPQMRQAPSAEPTTQDPPATFGRRRSDRMFTTIVPEKPAKTLGTGLSSAPSGRALVIALCLLAAFALGYVVGVAAPPI